MTTQTPSAKDFKNTVFLPDTIFPMRANLGKREPIILERWQKMDLYKQIMAARKQDNAPLFTLHDGPPYANGHLHMGHALNKTLKDVINRTQSMLGKQSTYIPGWDCHGLPIEWKIEEEYRARGQDKDDVPILEFRKECREFADKWVKIQNDEFQRLGIVGDWDAPYLTMSYDAEAQIAREIAKFAMNGSMYRGSKPVMWSIVEKTALAEAEVEYYDHKSPSIFVRFPVKDSPIIKGDADIVIWTTTPWTIPANQAIAYGTDVTYAVIKITDVSDEKSTMTVGDRLLLAEDLLGSFAETAKIGAYEIEQKLQGSELDGTTAHHPLYQQGFEGARPLLAADFVTTESGTGLVHIAPGHGTDDYQLGLTHNLPMPMTVNEEGCYYDHVPVFAGKRIQTREGKDGDANGAVIKALLADKRLAGKASIRHSYPHSWRSKAPLIYRNTPQWFISMEQNDLREKALSAISETAFYPEKGRARLHSMIENRPDWCISRQRAWGVPIAIFVNKASGEILRDQAVFDRIADYFESEGGDSWFARPVEDFLGSDYQADEWEQVTDIIDVWFDSGSTHSFVLEGREDVNIPADLYLEGSDQHRGWFHSSLLESCGTRGRAPYKGIVTHGFLVDEKGHKMSKSLGNGIEPQEIIETYGVDILRLWVVSSDYTEDLRLGKDIIKQTTDIYRRFRNTLRYLLGALKGFDADSETVPHEELPELEQWMLHRLNQVGDIVKQNSENYDLHGLHQQLHHFCALDLSAFYFDIRKDSLYCDAPTALSRRACRTVMHEIFRCLTSWLAPILCFTAEEAWLAFEADQQGKGLEKDQFLTEIEPDHSLHMQTYRSCPAEWSRPDLDEKWQKIKDMRRVITGALEIARKDKTIGSSLQAAPIVYASEEYLKVIAEINMADICIASDLNIKALTDAPKADEQLFTLSDVAGVRAQFALASGEKCQRCWKILPEVADHADHICGRCDTAISVTA